MQTPSTLSIWLSEQAGPLALIALLVGFVLVVLYFSARNHGATMKQKRAGATEDTFVDFLTAYGFDAKIARTTYRYLQEKQRVSYPIEARDQLDEDLGLGSADVAETVEDLLALNDRQLQPGRYHTPLVTVEDLARFIQASPRLSRMAA